MSTKLSIIVFVTVANSNRAYVFGGVQDVAKESGVGGGGGDDSDDDDEDAEFFNDIYTIQVDSNEKAAWQKGTK